MANGVGGQEIIVVVLDELVVELVGSGGKEGESDELVKLEKESMVGNRVEVLLELEKACEVGEKVVKFVILYEYNVGASVVEKLVELADSVQFVKLKRGIVGNMVVMLLEYVELRGFVAASFVVLTGLLKAYWSRSGDKATRCRGCMVLAKGLATKQRNETSFDWSPSKRLKWMQAERVKVKRKKRKAK